MLLGNGDGTFQAPDHLRHGLVSRPPWPSADVNGDGKPDLIVAITASSNGVSVLLGNGNGTFQPLTSIRP